MQGWTMVKNEFQEVLREITMLGFGLVLICHSKERQSPYTDADGNSIMSVEPDLSKAAYTICNAICDVIGYINVEFDNEGKSNRYLYTRQTPTIFAGSRYKYLEGKIPFGYNELVDAIGRAIDREVENGATAVDHTEYKVAARKSFAEVMEEAKKCWIGYLDSAKTEEEKEQKLNLMKDVVRRIFGNDQFKLSAAVPSQQDLIELFIEEMKEMKEI